jgi:hypothetical protein
MARGIHHNVCVNLFVDSDSRPLDDDCVAIQIAE